MSVFHGQQLLWCISPANCPFFSELYESFKQTQWAVPSEQCGSLRPNFGTPCRNLDEIYALQKKSLKTVALFIFILLQGQGFSNQEMTQRSPGLYKYRIFFIFLVNRYSTILDYIRKHCFQCIHSSGRNMADKHPLVVWTWHLVYFCKSQVPGFSQFSLVYFCRSQVTGFFPLFRGCFDNSRSKEKMNWVLPGEQVTAQCIPHCSPCNPCGPNRPRPANFPF